MDFSGGDGGFGGRGGHGGFGGRGGHGAGGPSVGIWCSGASTPAVTNAQFTLGAPGTGTPVGFSAQRFGSCP
jgi:hypothetical protein